MISRKDIQATCDDIVREFSPLQVILFGSYAYGTPTEDSDVDLLVVMDIPESETRHHAVDIRQRIPRRFPMDVLVRSPEEIAYRISYNDWFLREITEKGEVLYGPNNLFTKILERQRDSMNQLTLEWIQKAEGDYDAIKLHRQVASPNFDLICFHAQQCIEKYLKAWLQEANIRFSKTHDLESLLDLIVPTISAWDAWRVDFSTVSDHAVDFRYPGKSATAENAEHATQVCTEVRQAIRSELKLPQNELERQV